MINVRFNNQIFEGKIYRRSNHGYPRIYLGPVLSIWLSQFEINSIINIRKANDTLKLEITI